MQNDLSGVAVAVPIQAERAPAAAEKPIELRELGAWLAECFKRLFSEARILARMKIATFGSLLLFLGMGMAVRFAGATAESSVGMAQFILSAPDTIQTVGAVSAFALVISSNIYARVRRQKHEQFLLTLAACPDTPADVRSELLRRLAM